MPCATLNELPSPPPGRSGWLWTEESTPLPRTRLNVSSWPRIGVVTPSFNQARFLEVTLRSILLQGYPDLELFVLDGGSSDGSIDIIRKYEPWITAWVSERDDGQSAAINRGLRMCSGAFATWINSDDMLCRNALSRHATEVGFDGGVVYLGDCPYIDEHGNVDQIQRGRVHTFQQLVSIRSIWRGREDRGNIDQPSVLFPLALALQVGGLDVTNHRTMDYELWGKFLLAGARFRYTEIPFGMFRVHAQQKTGDGWATTRSLVATAVKLLMHDQDTLAPVRDELIADLRAYEREYWRDTGRLTRIIELPANIVLPLRRLCAWLHV